MKFILHETARYLCPTFSEQSMSDEIDTEYILSLEAVIKQQDYICGEIGAPTTIIQFKKDKNNDWERIDSQVSAITLRTSCDLLRRCINNEGRMCRECDASHAGLFFEMNEEQLKSDEFKRSIKQKKKALYESYHNPHHKPCIEYKYGRSFLSYNCPMLGYRELVFPILFEKNVVAVFVVGQIKLKGNEEVIASSKDNFFRTHTDIFDDYLKDAQKLDDAKIYPEKYTRKSIMDYIVNKSIRGTKLEYPEIYNMKQGLQIPEVEDQLTQEKYDETVKKICRWLTDLEMQLIVEMRLKRENFARRVLSEALSNFHASSAGIDHSLSIREVLWNHVQKFVQNVAEQCALEYITIYSTQSIYERAVADLKVVASSKSEYDNLASSTYSLKREPMASLMHRPTDSKTSPELFNALSRPLQKERSLMSIVFQPMKEIPAASVAILVKYSSNTLKESMENALMEGMQNLSVIISSRLAMLFEGATQLQLEKSLRLYKHEMVNLSAGVSRAINDYLGNPNLKGIDKQKLQDVYRDASGTLGMFQFLSENIGILVNDPLPPKMKNVRVYHDLLYKWENIKRVDARDKGCDFIFQKSYINIYTDPRYAELVVYNLLTNAVKYSYDNTNIYLHCMKQPQKDSYKLSVTNFAFLIPEAERNQIFKIGYRAQKAVDYYPEGSGIGLWIVRVAMKQLGGKVKLCEPEWVSEYNVPLLHAYVNDPANYEDLFTGEEVQEAQNEYKKLTNEYIINDFGERQDVISWIVSTYNWSIPTESKVHDELHEATYMIRFEVNFNV